MREVKTKASRDINIDIVKVIAIVSVICTHFFNYIGIHRSNIASGNSIWIGIFCVQLFSCCVPLFILATGYLMNHKTLRMSYYKKSIGIIAIYLITSIIFQIYQTAVGNQQFNLIKILRSIITLDGSEYSWYIKMYIGLFLLIPFLNLIWNNLKTKKAKTILCLTLAALSILPNINIFGVHLPDYWLPLWPIALYFIGAYLKEFNFKLILQKRLIFLILSFGWACAAAVFTINNNNGAFSTTGIIAWNYPWTCLFSIAIFSFITSLTCTQKLPTLIKSAIVKISSLTLGTYLISAIFDNLIYRQILHAGDNPTYHLRYFFIITPIVFICSYFGAYIVNLIMKIPSAFKSKRNMT